MATPPQSPEHQAPPPKAYTVLKVASEADYRAVLALRKRVFVEEQNVPLALEIDEFETTSVYYAGKLNGETVACGRWRMLPDKRIKIERCAVSQPLRGRGLGAVLVRVMLAEIRKRHPAAEIILNAQLHALRFYERLGFRTFGDEFTEAGIAHRKMAYNPEAGDSRLPLFPYT